MTDGPYPDEWGIEDTTVIEDEYLLVTQKDGRVLLYTLDDDPVAAFDGDSAEAAMEWIRSQKEKR